MKAIVLLGLMLVGSSVVPAQAAEMRPLKEIVTIADPALVSFALKRCTAAFAALSALMQVDGGDLELSKRAEERSMAWYSRTLAHAKENGYTATAEETMQVVAKMAQLYSDEMDDSFMKTGSRMSVVFSADLEFCNAM